MAERLPQLPMIGRQKILDAICQKIDQDWGKKQIICLYGMGGIGKTRMLEEIVKRYDDAKKRDITILPHHPCIILIQENGKSEWSQEFLEGAKSMAREFSIEIECYDAEGNIGNMEELLRQVLRKKPEALLVREGSKESIRNIINQIVQQGIPVLTFDNNSSDMDTSVIKIMNEEIEGIKTLAFDLRDRLNYQGEVAVFREKSYLQQRREELFRHFLYDYQDIHVVATQTIICEADEIAKNVKRDLDDVRRRFPQLKAIWTTCDIFAKPLVDLLKGTNILLYSFDLDEKDVDLMIASESPWRMTTTTEPYKGGRIIVRLAMQKIHKEEHIPANHRLTPRMVSQEDVRYNRNIWREDDDYAWTPKLRSLISKERPIIRFLHTTSLKGFVDFDERSFRNPEKLDLEIAKGLDSLAFEPFLKMQADYFIMQDSRVSEDGLKRQHQAKEEAFYKCFNAYAENVRPVLLFDTFDEKILPEESDVWADFKAKLPMLKNTVIIIAGREAGKFGESLMSALKDGLEIIELKPLCVNDCTQYLQQKARQMHISVENELAEKLIFLCDGKPILLDLAVELRGRGIQLNWLENKSLISLYSNPSEKEKYRREFEHALVKHIAELRSSFDKFLIVAAYVNPLNEQMIATLLDISQENAYAFSEEAKQYMFIKRLTNGYIKLHDEMERMVNDHVWSEIDPENFRRTFYSKQACSYFKEEIKRITLELSEKRSEFNKFEQDDDYRRKGLNLDTALKIQDLDVTLWLIKYQQLRHTLFTDFEKEGITFFVELFNEASDPQTRRKLFDQLQQYENRFQSDHRTIRDFYKIKLWMNEKEHHQEAMELCEELLRQTGLSEEQTIRLLIMQGNLKIRLGDVKNGLQDFKTAVEKSEDGYNKEYLQPRLLIESEKELGWAYRLVGSFEKAKQLYEKAFKLCFKNGGPDNKDLQYDYGMILNNLAFVLSNNSETRDEAENVAKTAIDHWNKIGNKIGMGAGYLVLGIVYYRRGASGFGRALEEFQKAVRVFQRLRQTDWLGQVYAWRGITYRGLRDYQKAENDLNEALYNGAENLKAMILNRLGRVYMSRKEWDVAENFLNQSFTWAEKIPDPLYGLVSLSRLIMIAAERVSEKSKNGEENPDEIFMQLNDFDRRLKEYLERIREISEPDTNTEGIANIALARLAFRQNDRARIIGYLEKGIDLVSKYGSYAGRDETDRIEVIQRDFEHIDSEVIQEVGKALIKYTEEKQIKNYYKPRTLAKLYSWAHWGK